MSDISLIITSCLPITISILVTCIVLLCLYSNPNTPNLSIEEFSVPALNKTSGHPAYDLYFDLKLRNMNKAIGLYFDDPSSIAFSYYPLEDPYQKYTWVCTLPAFYQGNGKTKHIRSLPKHNHLSLSNNQVANETDQDDLLVMDVTTVSPASYQDHPLLRSLFGDYLQLPSMMLENGDGRKEVAKIDEPVKVVSFKINLIVNYRFKLWADSSSHELEVGADVKVDATTGERVTKGSIKLVKSGSSAGGPFVLMVLFSSFLLMSI